MKKEMVMKSSIYYIRVVFVFLILTSCIAVHNLFACVGMPLPEKLTKEKLSAMKCFVCGTDLCKNGEPVFIKKKGLTFSFCTKKCSEAFTKDPGKCLDNMRTQSK